jgi:hypothetical protein
MPKRFDYDDFNDDELEFINEYGEEELEELYELLEDFPEFEDYFDDIMNFDDEDFYSTTSK